MPRMRWDGIRVAGGSPGTPALFERDAVARTFDTPGFRGMTFFEVHARSVINRVPEASRMPLSHKCSSMRRNVAAAVEFSARARSPASNASCRF